MMKKLSAFFTAVGFACTLLTAIPISAETQVDIFVPVGYTESDTLVFLHYYTHDSGYAYGSTTYLEYDAPLNFDWTDTFSVDGSYTIEEIEGSERASLILSEDASLIRHENQLETESLIITSSIHTSPRQFDLKDSSGNCYWFVGAGDDVFSPFSLEDAQAGDIYTFTMFDYGSNHKRAIAAIGTGTLLPPQEETKPEEEVKPETVDLLVPVGYTDSDALVFFHYYTHDNGYAYGSATYLEYDAPLDFNWTDTFSVNGSYTIEEIEGSERASLLLSEDASLIRHENQLETESLTIIGSIYTSPRQFDLKDSSGNYYWFVSAGNDVLSPFSLEDAQLGDTYVFAMFDYGSNNKRAIAMIGTSEDNEEILPDGDANGDGTLDILDVIAVNKAVLGKAELSSDRIPHVDFNSNGVPDASDSLAMLRIILDLD